MHPAEVPVKAILDRQFLTGNSAGNSAVSPRRRCLPRLAAGSTPTWCPLIFRPHARLRDVRQPGRKIRATRSVGAEGSARSHIFLDVTLPPHGCILIEYRIEQDNVEMKDGGPVRNRTGIAGLGNRSSIHLSYGAAASVYRDHVQEVDRRPAHSALTYSTSVIPKKSEVLPERTYPFLS